MFIFFKQIGNSYLLKDTEFEEILDEHNISWYSISQLYEKRNLNVARNLILFIKSMYGNDSISEYIDRIIKFDIRLLKFKDEFEKYLILE